MFTDYMDLLFKEWNVHSPESEELNKAIDILCNADSDDVHIQSQKQEVLLNSINAEKLTAFRGGFACAVQLMK